MPTKSQEESISSMQRTKHGQDGASPLISVLADREAVAAWAIEAEVAGS
jgi:hypothetical protein